MAPEQEQKLRKALNELYNSNVYRELCKVVIDLTDTTIDSPDIQRMIDETLITRGAWIYDIINGKPSRGKTLTQKIRKTLGYTYP